MNSPHDQLERHTEPSQSSPAAPGARAPAGLWASAAVLVALILVAASGRFGPQRVQAEMAVVSSGYAAMTTRVSNEELLTVIDQPAETLMVYRVVNQSRVELVAHEKLPELFAAARASATGRN